jgi:hypothetical protein
MKVKEKEIPSRSVALVCDRRTLKYRALPEPLDTCLPSIEQIEANVGRSGEEEASSKLGVLDWQGNPDLAAGAAQAYAPIPPSGA